MSKSCQDCIFYLTPTAAKDFIKKNINGSVCAEFKTVLTTPNWTVEHREAALIEKAESCASFSLRSASGTDSAAKDPELWAGFDGLIRAGSLSQAAMTQTPRDPDLVKSCSTCSHFVMQPSVTAVTGWTTHACNARGSLISSRNLSAVAEACDYKSYRGIEPMSNMSGFSLFPSFLDTDVYAESKVNVIDNFLRNAAPVWIDPIEYPTDNELDEKDIKLGIRAWRKVTNPDDGNIFVFMPIFHTEHFTDEDQKKIPKAGSEEHPELYNDYGNNVYTLAVLWMAMDEVPTLWGDPGVGKTELLRYMAWLMNVPFERVSITDSSELDDLAGKMHLVVDPTTGVQVTRFEYGRVSKAWNRTCVLCIDEPNVGPKEVWQFLRPMIDNSKQLVLDQSSGERISRDDFCFLGLAMNPDWDLRNEGTNTIAQADRSRISNVFMELPPKEVEMRIIAARISIEGWDIKTEYLEQMMTIAKALREMCNNGAIPGSWGIRDQIKVAKALRWFKPAQAYRIAAADGYPPQVSSLILDIVDVTMSTRNSPLGAK